MIAFFLLYFSKILTTNDQVSSNEFKRHLKCDLGCPRLFCLPREGKSVPAFLMSCQLHLCIYIRCAGHQSNSTRKLCLENWIETRALHNVRFIISNITLLIMLKTGVKSLLKFVKKNYTGNPVQSNMGTNPCLTANIQWPLWHPVIISQDSHCHKSLSLI